MNPQIADELAAGLSLLAGYPKMYWTADAPVNWGDLVSEFHESAAEAAVPDIKAMNPERKWECVSAYQKAVRRGDIGMALKMVGAFNCRPEFADYFWRRVVVTAAEDIGPANPGLMAFLLAAHEVWKPKKAPNSQKEVWARLTGMMCKSKKSRAYCSMSVIEGLLAKQITVSGDETGCDVLNWEIKEELSQWEIEFMAWLKDRPADLPMTVAAWCRKKGALAEGLSAYYSSCPDLEQWEHKPAEYGELILGLPQYAYDMHTKVGKTATYRLQGYKRIKELLAATECTDKAKAIGWAMFFQEGGRLYPEWYCADVVFLESKLAYNSFGLMHAEGLALQDEIQALLESGDLHKLRLSLAKAAHEGVQK